MRNVSATENFYEQKRCGLTISMSLYFYFLFIEKIILSSENRFARSPERGEFFDPATQFCFFLYIYQFDEWVLSHGVCGCLGNQQIPKHKAYAAFCQNCIGHGRG